LKGTQLVNLAFSKTSAKQVKKSAGDADLKVLK
jgi:hypothetical protein